MSKTKAYVDTTIVADALLKIGPDAERARSALRRYAVTQLPVYAIKEFKAGPLGYVNYLLRKLLETGSYDATLLALARIAKQPNRIATCLRLLSDLRSKIINSSANSSLSATYGTLSDADKVIFDSLVLECRTLVLKAWLRCTTLTTEIVDELPCYDRRPPKSKRNGEYDLAPTTCQTSDCCMTKPLRGRKLELNRLVSVINRLPSKRENPPRAAVLHSISVRSNFKMSNDDCRKLGDAVFALYCPKDADILTTNVVDHQPLADALKKTVESP